MQDSKKCMKYFLASILSTSLIILLFCGFVIVEKNTRYIAFGDNTPFFSYAHSGFKPLYLKIHFMGKDYSVEFS